MLLRLSAIIIFLCTIAVKAHTQSVFAHLLVIDELMPDPTPSHGLPESEFLELRNVSADYLQLNAWQIGDGVTTATIRDSFLLPPDSVVIICSSGSANALGVFGRVLVVSRLPALDNDGKTILLISPDGKIQQTISYDLTWYGSPLKSTGGWSLEMIDPQNRCGGAANWQGSVDPQGGTPGRINSSDAANPDAQPPTMLSTYTLDDKTLVAEFDEPLDSTLASAVSHYRLSEIGTPLAAMPIGPDFHTVRLNLPAPMKAGLIYHVTAEQITDCAGNLIGTANNALAGLPELPAPRDLAINEILFNPATNGYDYVEIYNRANKIFDLKNLAMASLDPSGQPEELFPLSKRPRLFFPGQFDVFTENRQWVQENYFVRNPDQLIQMDHLPSLPDDQGSFGLVNADLLMIDRLQYSHQWHFALTDDETGIALERISFDRPTQEPGNWTSAAASAGFGTPTDRNSEQATTAAVKGAVTISPTVFSPDHDGYQDFTFIHYALTDPGFVLNVTIFDALGRRVRYLVKNETLGLSADYRWDGLDDQQAPMATGVYLVCSDLFSLTGQRRKFFNTVTLARLRR